MPGRLRSFVHVHGEHGRTHVFGPDDEVPDWAAAKITNPRAWDEPPNTDGEEDDAQPDTSGQTPGSHPAPSANKDVWLAFATVRGVDVPDGATKQQIIDAVEAAEQE